MVTRIVYTFIFCKLLKIFQWARHSGQVPRFTYKIHQNILLLLKHTLIKNSLKTTGLCVGCEYDPEYNKLTVETRRARS